MDEVAQRLRNEIACELYAQLLIRDDAIEQPDITGVGGPVAGRRPRALQVQWTPPLDEDDTLGPDAATFHGSVLGDARYPIFDWDGETGYGTSFDFGAS
jgi:hypothetical protein